MMEAVRTVRNGRFGTGARPEAWGNVQWKEAEVVGMPRRTIRYFAAAVAAIMAAIYLLIGLGVLDVASLPSSPRSLCSTRRTTFGALPRRSTTSPSGFIAFSAP